MKVKDLLTDVSKWTCGAYARNKTGLQVHEENEEACKFCLAGAVYKCYKEDPEKIFVRISVYITSITGRYYSVETWNDKIATFQDIREMLVELDI